MTAIELRSVTHRYAGLTAIDDVSFQVPDGAIFGLIGPNGAGKTTIIRIICTLLAPASGDVHVRGQSVRQNRRAIKMSLGYMPDTPGSYDELRVWEYLDFYARCYELPPSARPGTISDLLELVDLTAKRDSYVYSLSRGMHQRLALARTLLHDPAVLVLDEPAAGLDPRARVELRDLLQELQQFGKTILLSSHILSDLAEICSHVAILERGRLVAQGALPDVLHQARVGRRIVIEMIAPAEIPPDLAERVPELRRVTIRQEPGRVVLQCSFAGDDASLAQVLAQLVAAGLPVVGLREDHTDLEEVFMRVTGPLSS